MMKFYKENDISPVSGCLPLLLQMPVFIFLYRVILGLIHRPAYGTDMGAAVARAAGGKNGGVLETFGHFAPQHLDKTSKLYLDLTHTSTMKSWGLDLANSASKSLTHGFGTALPLLILVLGVAATSYIQQKQVSARAPQAADANPQQQMLLKLMPAFFAVISLGLPAGVVVYFFVSNLFRIGQQAFITKTMYGDTGILHTTGSEVDTSSTKVKADAPAPKGFLALLGVDKESLPNPNKAKRDFEKTPVTAGAKPARGSAAVTPPKGKVTPPAPKGKPVAAAAKKTSSNGKGSAPSRNAPPAPTNRSRNKKKRK
jgi:YidC/Oxa1 family membrane protein insertase